MALAPRLYDIATFDATEEASVQFVWSGDQSFGSILTINDNETNATVYSGTYLSMGRDHLIPADTLTNGRCYNAYIEVLGSDETVISAKSNTVIFYCYKTPVIGFDNISGSDGSIHAANSTYTVVANYAQDEHDPLAQYQILLYDGNRSLVYNPGISYQTEYTTSISQTFTGLENGEAGTHYYVRATGKTEHDVFVDSGYQALFVRYENPEVFSKLELVNDSKEGRINIKSNLISITGVMADGSEPVYINGELIDLRDGKVIFSDGFSMPENWTVGANVCGITPNIPLLTWWDGDLEANVIYREAEFDLNEDVKKGYFEVLLDGPTDEEGNVIWHTIINSNFIDPVEDPETSYIIWIRKEDGYYLIRAVKTADASL